MIIPLDTYALVVLDNIFFLTDDILIIPPITKFISVLIFLSLE